MFSVQRQIVLKSIPIFHNIPRLQSHSSYSSSILGTKKISKYGSMASKQAKRPNQTLGEAKKICVVGTKLKRKYTRFNSQQPIVNLTLPYLLEISLTRQRLMKVGELEIQQSQYLRIANIQSKMMINAYKFIQNAIILDKGWLYVKIFLICRLLGGLIQLNLFMCLMELCRRFLNKRIIKENLFRH